METCAGAATFTGELGLTEGGTCFTIAGACTIGIDATGFAVAGTHVIALADAGEKPICEVETGATGPFPW